MIRWGILGAGNIAHRFARSLQNEEDSILYAISGRSQEKLDVFQQEFPCEKTYVGHENMLNDDQVDAIYLALPHGMHKEWAIAALSRGIHVLCEKPAVLTEAEMKEIRKILNPEFNINKLKIGNKSVIMKENEFDFIHLAIKSRLKKEVKEIKKLYQATIDGDGAINFHSRCDNI